MSAWDRFLARLIVLLHFTMWSWGLWIVVVAGSFYYRIFAPAIALYLVIIAWQGERALDKHIYPTWMRSWSGWDLVAKYYSAQMQKTADLDPSGNYIFACHPHGITSFSSWLSFATEGTGFSMKFPGLKLHVLTLTTNLRMPFLREYLLLHGLSDVRRKTCLNILKSGRGQSIMLAIGGATESLYCKPGTCDLVLERRKGFVRVAVQTGASLVPVLNFGENELYNTYRPPANSALRQFQKWLEHRIGITVPIFWGQGLFKLSKFSLGLIPNAVPVTTVVGAPIKVQRFDGDIKTPDGMQLVDEYHSQYVTALKTLWNENKEKYAKRRLSELQIVE